MDRKVKFVLLVLAFVILIDAFLLLYSPGYTGPTIERVYRLDEIDCVRIGDINVVYKNGSWVVSSIQYPEGVVRGEKYNGSEGKYYPNVTITNDTISFNVGILISHLNESGLKERELKVVEWTHTASRVLIEKEEKSIPFNFSTPGLYVLRYSTKLPEPGEERVIKTIELKIPKLAKRPNGELIYAYDGCFVAGIIVKPDQLLDITSSSKP
ncbi:hypothetical protein [Archaeoglobus veneficus]|uniref:Uncharacterized protein n=1 Tax=Archaeoglobus veneficus (strain DSM 11195 / SNP6) TaxID=693661 RepID=F2KQK8_ARCVS|nr:hypothetical protein [Archaeoglobus veneficus]AEA47741.1 hypothetical protein Arcve_1743 [Archaeoglobus veneficus SNP6]